MNYLNKHLNINYTSENKIKSISLTNTPTILTKTQEQQLINYLTSTTPLNPDDFDLSTITPFQLKIYNHLRQVPTGKTITYQELAKKAGNPKAARAVGSAMAKNPFIILVPCHRVIKSDGSLGNYSAQGGVKTKAYLLNTEAKKG